MTDEEARALEQKYTTLASLRRERGAGADVPPAGTFRALAARFPGVLKQLDTLRLETIEARRDELAKGERAPWMAIEVDYHAHFVAALHVKKRVRARRNLDATELEALATSASAASARALPVAFVQALVAAPETRNGKLGEVVVARIAALHACDASAVLAAVFPDTKRATRVDT